MMTIQLTVISTGVMTLKLRKLKTVRSGDGDEWASFESIRSEMMSMKLLRSG